ncbi:hypothetical protein EIP91_004568 [Steccherinum ochraceum]|uniref:Uncharacterized protein n=1 Tax=Steccherinum ochraceum TaxID=92696 RepID=A0A4R0R8I0_9APHY|nr:hypothetical protein EIP91_004568 [Steccherinum ochraceum]
MTHNAPSNGTSQKPQRLDIEDDDDRLTRMHNVFMQLDSKATSQGLHPLQPRSFDLGDRSTFAFEPSTDLLSRVQAFLPEIAASNAQLELRARENPKSVDIENIRDGESYIQMTLAQEKLYETGYRRVGRRQLFVRQ